METKLFGEHEVISFCSERKIGLQAIIAIHSTQLGPALGGTRIFPYKNVNDALNDVLDLSRAMTYKAAAAELPFGGAKAVIIADPADPKKREYLKAFGPFVNLLAGKFQTGEDLGTTTDDMQFLRNYTPYSHFVPSNMPDDLQISALTARGVFEGIKASLEAAFGKPEIQGRHFAIQGLGKVGGRLVKLLAKAGARLTITDVNSDLSVRIANAYGASQVPPGSIYAVDCDLFSPCAAGHVLTEESIEQLKCQVIAGCANNQLDHDGVAELIKNKGILYAPDFVINGGGLISAMREMEIESEEQTVARVDAIGDRLRQIYRAAEAEKISPLTVVYRKIRKTLH